MSTSFFTLKTITTPLCFLLLILLRTVTSFEAQNMLSDRIGAGEVRFYTVESKEPVIIALVSDSGDADMYASPTSKNSHPSPNDYDYTSASCGLDVMVLDTNKDQSRMTVGVYGHVRYEETMYRLYVISPNEEDIRRYQIWDWDPESNSNKLLIDVDPLFFANDPTLNRLLDHLAQGGVAYIGGRENASMFQTILEWTGIVVVKILQIALEILV